MSQFHEKHGPTMGRLVIKDHPIMGKEGLETLERVWDTVKETIQERYNLCIEAHFRYDKEDVVGVFFLDEESIRKNHAPLKAAKQTFKATFPAIMTLFITELENEL